MGKSPQNILFWYPNICSKHFYLKVCHNKKAKYLKIFKCKMTMFSLLIKCESLHFLHTFIWKCSSFSRGKSRDQQYQMLQIEARVRLGYKSMWGEYRSFSNLVTVCSGLCGSKHESTTLVWLSGIEQSHGFSLPMLTSSEWSAVDKNEGAKATALTITSLGSEGLSLHAINVHK